MVNRPKYIDRAVRLAKSDPDLSVDAIARRVGKSWKVVNRALRESGIDVDARRAAKDAKRRREAEEQRDRVCRMLDEGMTPTEIARELQLTRQRIAQIIALSGRASHV